MELIADLDLVAGRLLISDGDGFGVEHPIAPIADETQISRVRFDFGSQTLSIVTPDQVTATIAVHLGVARQQAYLADRLIVYLDQNQWSKIDAVLHGRSGVSALETAAATVLVAMVQRGRVIFPLSAAHAVETGAMHGERRTQLASTMLELSQGWLMRNPTWIKQEEFTTARRGNSGASHAVFTQDADQWFTRSIHEPRMSDAPEPFAGLFKPVVNALSIASMLLSPEQVQDEGGRAAASGWAGSRQGAADNVRVDRVPAQRARAIASAQTLFDSVHEAQRAWEPDSDGFRAWVPDSYDDISLMPALSRVRAIFYGRIRNGARWEGNDLNDVMYLTTAAGYADLVVGERHTIAELRNATQITPGARVVSNLKDAVVELVDLHAARQPTATPPATGEAALDEASL